MGSSTPRRMHFGSKESLPEPPEGSYWAKRREWRGCALHDTPEYPDECECCGRGDGYPEGCTCATAKWVYFHTQWVLEANLHGISLLLRDVYVPIMAAAMNEPVFLKLLRGEQ
jgi:hypothetical protein